MIEFCRRNNIMAQGRGSAANSTVCFCLGTTAVDPIRFNTLFERFLTERGLITKSAIEDLQRRINHEIDEAIQIAEKDPFPEPEDCLKDVYYEGPNS